MIARIAIAGLGLLLFAGVAVLAAVGQSNGPPTAPDRPIRRVTLSGEAASAALGRVAAGDLVRLAPAEFDRLAAGPAGAAPRLVETRYRARLVTGDAGVYLTGTAEWSVRHPGTGDAVLALTGLQVPVRQPRWSDGQDAVVFKAAGDPHPTLYLPAGGNRTLNLDWSARGAPAPGETRFDLRLPAAPLASLELVLPLEVRPVLPQAEALLTGPYPAEHDTQAWRVQFAGIAPVELVLRRRAERTPALFVRTAAVYRLAGTEGTARVELQVETAKAGFGDLVVEHDPDLTLTSISVNNLAGWEAESGGGPVRRAVVRLREPARSATVVVTGTFPVPWQPGRWSGPRVGVSGGVCRSERLRFVVGPAFRFSDWRPGDYRLVRAGPGPGQAFEIEAEPATPGPPADRPSLVLTRRGDVLGAVIQHAEWAVGPRSESWVVRTTAPKDHQGSPPFRFTVPDGWEVQEVTTGGRAVAWATAGRELVVASAEAASAAGDLELVTRLIRRRSAAAGRLAVPDLFPLGSAGRAGLLVIRPDPSVEAVASDPVPARPPSEPGPTPSARTRVLTAEPLVGWLDVRDHSARAAAESEIEIVTRPDGEAIDCRLTLRPEAGSISELTFWTAGPVAEPWVWRDAAGRRVGDAERWPPGEAVAALLALGPGPAPAATRLVTAGAAAGCWWRLRLPSPVDRSARLLTSYTAVAGSGDVLPIAWVVGSAFRCTVTLPPAVPAGRLDPRLAPAGERDGGTRVFRYDGVDIPQVDDTGRRYAGEIENPRLLTRLAGNGECRAELRFRVRHWSGTTLAIRLPEVADSPAASVGARPVMAARDGHTLHIPVPTGDQWIPVVVRYALPSCSATLAARVVSPLPTGPFMPDKVRQVWHLSPSWEPHTPPGLRRVAGTPAPGPDWPLPDLASIWTTALTAIEPPSAGESLADGLRRQFPGGRVLIDTVAVGRKTTGEPAAGSPVDEALENAYRSDLVALRSSVGVLVTSRAEARRLIATERGPDRLPRSVSDRLAESATCGRDSSGRYRTLAVWQSAVSEDFGVLDTPDGWTILEADGLSTGGLLVLHRQRSELAAWVAAVILLLSVTMIRRRRVRTALVLVAVLLALVASGRFPEVGRMFAGPVLFAAVAAGLIGVCHRRGDGPRPRPPGFTLGPAVAGIGSAIAGLVVASVAGARVGPVDDVFQILGEDGRRSAVLVPPAVLERLRGGAPVRPDVVITEAVYSGHRDGGVGRFRVRYRVFVFGDAAPRVVLPVAGVRVRRVTLDGAEPPDVQAVGDQLRIQMSGGGPHVVEIDFTAAVQATGPEREIRFPVPEIPASHVTFDLASPAARLRAASWRGAVRVTTSPRSHRLEAELGAVPAVAVRWQEGADAGALSRVTAASVWQVGAGGAALTGVFDYRISGGSIADVHVAIPAGCEVYRVSARTEPAPASGQPALVRDWSVRDRGAADRVLTVEFLVPVSGRLVLGLDLVATTPPAVGTALQFPRPFQVTETTVHAAVAVIGPEPTFSGVDGLVERPADTFQTVWRGIDGGPPPGRLVRAFQVTGTSPRLTLGRPPREALPSATETVGWWVQDGRLVGTGESRWVGGDLSLLEWTFPPDVQVTDLTARAPIRWSQAGGRVQAWFDRPVTDPVVTWRAVRPGGGPVVSIPVPGHPTARTERVVARVCGLDGRVLTFADSPLGVQGLPPEVPGEIAWQATEGRSMRVRVLPPVAAARLRTRTSCAVDGGRVRTDSRIELSGLPPERGHLLTLTVAAGDGADVQLVAPPPVAAADIGAEGPRRRWAVFVPPGAASAAAVSVTTTANGSAVLPSFRVRLGPGADADLDHIVHVDRRLIVSDRLGLELIGAGEWRLLDSGLCPRLSVTGRPAGLGGPTVERAEVTAARAGGRWLYRGRVVVGAGEADRLSVVVPPTCRWLEAAQGGLLLPVGTGPLHLHPIAGARTLTLLWESDQPVWEPATVRSETDPLPFNGVDWTVVVPPGFRLEGDFREVGGPAAPVEFEDHWTEDREVFTNGAPYRWRAPGGRVPDLRLVRETKPSTDWRLAAAVGLWFVVAGLAGLWPHRTGPEQAAGLGALAAVTLGPAAVAFWIVPVYAAGRRLRQFARWLATQRRSAAPVGEFLN